MKPQANDGSPLAWVFVAGTSAPAAWATRAVAGYLVPLEAHEVAEVRAGTASASMIDREDHPLAVLVARGLPPGAIASELGVSLRTTHRRVAKLRRRIGVASTRELAQRLRVAGFG